MPRPFLTKRRIEFADTDMAGIVHFARFFNFMEEAEHAFLRSRGLSVVMVHQGRQIGWPRVAASCDFLQPARFEDVLDIELALSRIGTKSLTYAAEFRLKADVMARGKLSCCCCLIEHGKPMQPIALPADIRQILEAE
jgi:YbgC/YbaW family acyl-CoA thioester hydrolase